MTVAAGTHKTTAWALPAYRYLLGSEAVTLAGSGVSAVALPALAVLELRATAGQVATLAFLGQLPSTLALWAGALSDRHAKRFQLLVSDLVAAAALTTIPAAALAGVLTIGQLYGVTLAMGAAKVVRDAAAISLLPAIVAPHLLHDANSRLGAASSVADSAGSNVGAALVGAVGAARSLLVDATSFLASAWLVWRIRAPEPHMSPVGAEKSRGLIRDISAGVRYVIGQPTIRTVIAALAVLSFGLALIKSPDGRRTPLSPVRWRCTAIRTAPSSSRNTANRPSATIAIMIAPSAVPARAGLTPDGRHKAALVPACRSAPAASRSTWPVSAGRPIAGLPHGRSRGRRAQRR
ncbi:MFS transporter [Streptomyces sp. NPDC006339]|uniref:MFS transporter n=1 Tax=Streptomyces sp. NPDC006339 TaxID=3156755 RepID=UPI0033BCA64D